MTPLEIVQDVVTISRAVYAQAQLVESNKQRWLNLVEVIQQITSSLQGLDTLPEQENFVMSLRKLQANMKEIAEFLDKMQKMPYWKRFALAGRHQKKIDQYRQDLFELLPLLQLGLSAQNLLDQHKDRQAELADREAFMREQEAQLKERQAAHIHEKRELEALMHKQLASFRVQLEKNWRAQDPSPDSPDLPEPFQLKLYDITFEDKVLSSRTGDIYRASWQGQSVWVKFVEGIVAQSDREQFIREAKIMSRLHHEALVPFYGACFEPGRLCIVTGRVEATLLSRLGELDLDTRYRMAHELAEGLAYLHQRNIIHSDIHPQMIGVTRHGQARWLDLSWVKTDLASLASLGVAHDCSIWQAPETWYHRHQVTPASDVYSFGWLLWSLYTGKMPFDGEENDALLRAIEARNLREEMPKDCPQAYADLVNACWAADPRHRPDWDEILSTLSQPLHPPRPVSPSGEAYYEQGKKAEQAGDLDTALASYSRSAEKSYYKSFNSLGTFALGKGGQSKDPDKATTYFTQGAQAGHPPAMFNLGRMYEKGDTKDNTVDLNTALFWYEQAAKTDDTEPRYQEKVTTITAKLNSRGHK
ncbi:MAG: protein kinase [Gammaproteobacteria bacterium]|nr:protein kinase [Gammaproteobacteria bacterium]MCD8542597.1 protein kinase [Gammaproteobacteria bacterium]